MRFDTKIAVVLRDDLAEWQRLNMTAFLAGLGMRDDAKQIDKVIRGLRLHP